MGHLFVSTEAGNGQYAGGWYDLSFILLPLLIKRMCCCYQ